MLHYQRVVEIPHVLRPIFPWRKRVLSTRLRHRNGLALSGLASPLASPGPSALATESIVMLNSCQSTPSYDIFPLVMTNVAIGNCHWYGVFLWKMVVFHSYLSLLEGMGFPKFNIFPFMNGYYPSLPQKKSGPRAYEFGVDAKKSQEDCITTLIQYRQEHISRAESFGSFGWSIWHNATTRIITCPWHCEWIDEPVNQWTSQRSVKLKHRKLDCGWNLFPENLIYT